MHRLVSALFLSALVAPPALAGKHHHDPDIVVDVQKNLVFGGATLGVGVTDINPDLRVHFGAPEDAGVLVSKVVPGSAAEVAGVKVGDVIVRMGGVEISNGMVLRHEVQRAAGGQVSLDVVRNGKIKELNPEIAEADGSGPQVFHWSGDPRDFPGELELHGLEGLQDFLPPAELEEFDDLHLRLDDLEHQLLEMTERMEDATTRLEERLQQLER